MRRGCVWSSPPLHYDPPQAKSEVVFMPLPPSGGGVGDAGADGAEESGRGSMTRVAWVQVRVLCLSSARSPRYIRPASITARPSERRLCWGLPHAPTSGRILAQHGRCGGGERGAASCERCFFSGCARPPGRYARGPHKPPRSSSR